MASPMGLIRIPSQAAYRRSSSFTKVISFEAGDAGSWTAALTLVSLWLASKHATRIKNLVHGWQLAEAFYVREQIRRLTRIML